MAWMPMLWHGAGEKEAKLKLFEGACFQSKVNGRCFEGGSSKEHPFLHLMWSYIVIVIGSHIGRLRYDLRAVWHF